MSRKLSFYLAAAIMAASCTGIVIEPVASDSSQQQDQPSDRPQDDPFNPNPPQDTTGKQDPTRPDGPQDSTGTQDPIQPSDPSDPQDSTGQTDPVPSDVVIEDDDTSEDNVALTTFDGTIYVAFNGSDATVTGSVDGVSVSKSGAHVTVTNSGDNKVKYVLSGSSSDGCFKLYSSKKQALQLSNLSLTNASGAAINNQSKKRTFVIIDGTNTLCDCYASSGDYPGQSSDEDEKAAFFSEGQLVFSGTGTGILSVTARGKAGITSDDYVRFMKGSNVIVSSSAGHGVRGKDQIIVSGGTVSVTLSSSATGKKCFSTDSLVCITAGSATLTNNASAGNVDGELTGASCIKADQAFVIQGGSLVATATGTGCKCISGDASGYFEGGTVVAKSTGGNYGSGSSSRSWDDDSSVSSKAIKFDGKLEFLGSDVTVSCSAHEAIESKGVINISAGTISATSGDDAINSSSSMTISGGVVYAYSTGNDGLDANGNLYITGGTVYAICSGSPEVGIDANTEGGFKLYLQGGNVIAIGGIESGSSISQNVISTNNWTRNTNYSLCNGTSALYSFKTPSSGGSGLFMSAPSLVSGTSYSLKTSATVSGAQTYFDGVLSVGGTASGGSSTNVTASSYGGSGGGGDNPGGGGGDPHGPHGPGR